jgi:hypothetical protein
VTAGAWAMALALLLMVGSLLFVIGSMVRSIRDHRTSKGSVWREFGLGLGLMILFFATWIAHLIAEWQLYTDEQRTHGEATEVGDFLTEFAQSTLENWQSEFLQLFAFVVLAALYVHRGSAESKDSDDRMEASLHRIEQHLGTLPTTVSNLPDPPAGGSDVPEDPART